MLSPTYFPAGALIIVCSNDSTRSPTGIKDVLQEGLDIAMPPYEFIQENKEGEIVIYHIHGAEKERNAIYVTRIR